MTDPSGRLVEFIDKNRMNLALVQGVKGKRLSLLTSAARQTALPQSRVLLMTPSEVSLEDPRERQTEYMREVQQRRQALAADVDVTELWELVFEETEPLPLSDLAELVFGGQFSQDHLSAVLRALFEERVHFKLAGNSYVPLSAEQLEKKQQQMQAEALHRAEVDAAVEYLTSLPEEGPPPEPPDGLLDHLAELVVLGDEAPTAKLTKEIVSLAQVGGRRKLFDLLVRLGHFQPHENLAVRQEQAPVAFSQAAESAAREFALPAGWQEGREDLSGQYTFTIDGNFTTDFDDALSFDPDPDGGGVLGVHITDAAALLPPGHTLHQEAMERGGSIYLPDDRIPMLPPRLSEDVLSLREGQHRPTISCVARIDAEGRVVQWRVLRSALQVSQRITYDESDYLITNDSRFSAMFATCQALRRQRREGGAYFLPLPEVLVGVDEEGKVWVRRIDREGDSRQMVAETAIVANWLFARYLAENQVPTLYRTQAAPRKELIAGDPEDLFANFSQRRLLNRVEITTKPGRHSSLGAEPYVQATSPMRRYLDLVTQAQLGAHLAGAPLPYGAEELEQLATLVQPNVRRGFRIRQARQRYWILKWFEARRDEPAEALVMEKQTRRWQLVLTDTMTLVSIPVRPGLVLEPGQRVMVEMERVDAFADILRVKLL